MDNNVLSNEDILALISRAKMGENEAFEKIIKAYRGLVGNIVSHYSCFQCSSLSNEDLFQDGILGLIEAIKRFDFEKGKVFSTYATYYVKKYVQESFIKMANIVCLNEYSFKKLMQFKKTLLDLKEKNGRNPSISEIIKEMHLPFDNICLLLSICKGDLSIDYKYDDNKMFISHECLDDTTAIMAESGFLKDELEHIFIESGLTSNEIMTLKMQCSESKYQQQEIASFLGVTTETVRNYRKRALSKIRKNSDIEHLKVYSQ